MFCTGPAWSSVLPWRTITHSVISYVSFSWPDPWLWALKIMRSEIRRSFWFISVSSRLTESCSKGHNTDNSLCRKTWTAHLGSSYFSSRWHLHQSIMSSAHNALLKSAYSSKNCFFFDYDAVFWFNMILVPIHVHPIFCFGLFLHDQCLGYQSAAQNHAVKQQRMDKYKSRIIFVMKNNQGKTYLKPSKF